MQGEWNFDIMMARELIISIPTCLDFLAGFEVNFFFF